MADNKGVTTVVIIAETLLYLCIGCICLLVVFVYLFMLLQICDLLVRPCFRTRSVRLLGLFLTARPFAVKVVIAGSAADNDVVVVVTVVATSRAALFLTDTAVAADQRPRFIVPTLLFPETRDGEEDDGGDDDDGADQVDRVEVLVGEEPAPEVGEGDLQDADEGDQRSRVGYVLLDGQRAAETSQQVE